MPTTFHGVSNWAIAAVPLGVPMGETEVTVADGQGDLYPTAPFWAVLYRANLGSAYQDTGREVVECTDVTGDVLTIVRGVEGDDQDHPPNCALAVNSLAQNWQELVAAIEDANHLYSDTDRWYSGASDDMALGYDGTAGVVDTSAVAPSDLDLTCGANKTLRLVNPVYDDLPPSPIIAAKVGASAPTLATFLGAVEQYTFDATNDYVIGSTEITHGYAEGTNLEAHIHWATNGTEASAAYVKWQLNYTIGNPDGSAPYTQAFGSVVTLSPNIEIPANTPDRAHILSSLGTITGTSLKIGAYICWKLSRIAATGTAPAAHPFALAIGFHAEQDTMGSRTIYGK